MAWIEPRFLQCVVFVPVMTRYSGTVSQDEVDGLGLVWLPALRLVCHRTSHT